MLAAWKPKHIRTDGGRVSTNRIVFRVVETIRSRTGGLLGREVLARSYSTLKLVKTYPRLNLKDGRGSEEGK